MRHPAPISLTFLLTFLLSILLLALCVQASASMAPRARVLVFTKTTGWRHDSYPLRLLRCSGWARRKACRSITARTRGTSTSKRLARYQAVVFANTTLDVLDAEQQAAMEGFVRAGGGFMGIHSAADTEYDWPWYGELVGAWFKSHPQGLQTLRVLFEGENTEATEDWTVTDELYNYRGNPRERVQVLATVQEADYDGGTMGADHPINWCHAFDGGRAWYTGLDTASSCTRIPYSSTSCGAACATRRQSRHVADAGMENARQGRAFQSEVHCDQRIAGSAGERITQVDGTGAVQVVLGIGTAGGIDALAALAVGTRRQARAGFLQAAAVGNIVLLGDFILGCVRSGVTGHRVGCLRSDWLGRGGSWCLRQGGESQAQQHRQKDKTFHGDLLAAESAVPCGMHCLYARRAVPVATIGCRVQNHVSPPDRACRCLCGRPAPQLHRQAPDGCHRRRSSATRHPLRVAIPSHSDRGDRPWSRILVQRRTAGIRGPAIAAEGDHGRIPL